MIRHVLRMSACLASCALATWLSPAWAQSPEVIEGLLEHGRPYSALFTLSPESGDLVGYAFRNDTGQGQAILTRCMPGLFCQVPKALTRRMPANISTLKFSEAPVAWFEITHAVPAQMVNGSESQSQADTRFGPVRVRDDLTLLFKGKPTIPPVEGNSALSIVDVSEVDGVDVVVTQSTGGKACPALFRFVAVSAKGVQVSPEVGTCSELHRVSVEGKAVVLQMPTMTNERAKVIYRFANGKVTQTQQPVTRPAR